MSEFTEAYKDMIRVHGWNGTAATLGLKRQALEQRVYDLNGHGMRVETAMLLQNYSGTKAFAQAVAAASGGVFFELPDVEATHSDELHAKFHELYKEIGNLSATYMAATADNQIDKDERRALEAIEQRMHKAMRELMALMFLIYCPPGAANPADKG
jgi:hypothetical protein